MPWFRPQQRLIKDADLPTSPQRLAQAEAAHEALVQFGYRPVGLDHYAKPDDQLVAKGGRVLRNFQGYTDDDADALVGLGASAIGRLPQGFAQNAPAVGNYSRAIAEGKLATVKGIALSDDDRLRGQIIERLMCDMAVDLDAIADESGFDVATDFSDELECFAAVSGKRQRADRRPSHPNHRQRPSVHASRRLGLRYVFGATQSPGIPLPFRLRCASRMGGKRDQRRVKCRPCPMLKNAARRSKSLRAGGKCGPATVLN